MGAGDQDEGDEGGGMNRDEVQKMWAGRGMDAMVAIEVMGWTYVDSDPDFKWSVPANEDGVVMRRRLPEFSTDISAAWEVVEKIKDYYAYIVLQFDSVEWIVHISDGTVERQTSNVSAPLAICRAALLAVSDHDTEKKGEG